MEVMGETSVLLPTPGAQLLVNGIIYSSLVDLMALIPGFMDLEYATRKKEMANKFRVMLLIKCLNWMDCNMLLDNLHLTEAAFRNRSMIRKCTGEGKIMSKKPTQAQKTEV
ncbi:Os07g0674000 [Oryza sativa Japonica Group]|uniref:Uncharacterized protein n=3 Tax=Oryza TaxID=4527 RepID=A3BNC2_ORYSJ|nr:hypothetical protein OsJ_25549 [Oryza sativa Japonica Group]BAC80137.1 hypothetical protein [Oryza sativa Japonica Group]BAC84769.1 hypothetical protein [Oryza sativa Japonica Group]BAT03181.1 Os07g0674000 [Oryza sativa Japonica Group]